MPTVAKKIATGAGIILLIFTLYRLYPHLLLQIMQWQKAFNQQLSSTLHLVGENSTQAGWALLGVSFLYGVFHAIGPGHGKFILSGYLSLEQTKLPQAIRLTLFSALAQGVVAIAVVSVIIVLFTLSRSYFNQTLQWIERAGFVVLILFGLYWSGQAAQKLRPRKPFQIQKIRLDSAPNALVSKPHIHSENCGCGHQHTPSRQQLAHAQTWQSQLAIIFSIGSRPCSGAILVLFLANTLDLYAWGVAAALAMALGTGATLSLFAALVLLARHKAQRLSHWYLSRQNSQRFAHALKLVFGLGIILFGALMLHSTFLATNAAPFLFKR